MSLKKKELGLGVMDTSRNSEIMNMRVFFEFFNHEIGKLLVQNEAEHSTELLSDSFHNIYHKNNKKCLHEFPMFSYDFLIVRTFLIVFGIVLITQTYVGSQNTSVNIRKTKPTTLVAQGIQQK